MTTKTLRKVIVFRSTSGLWTQEKSQTSINSIWNLSSKSSRRKVMSLRRTSQRQGRLIRWPLTRRLFKDRPVRLQHKLSKERPKQSSNSPHLIRSRPTRKWLYPSSISWQSLEDSRQRLDQTSTHSFSQLIAFQTWLKSHWVRLILTTSPRSRASSTAWQRLPLKALRELIETWCG